MYKGEILGQAFLAAHEHDDTICMAAHDVVFAASGTILFGR
jgi:hypothetical protein